MANPGLMADVKDVLKVLPDLERLLKKYDRSNKVTIFILLNFKVLMTDFLFSMLYSDLNGQRTNWKSLFVHRVFAVQAHKISLPVGSKPCKAGTWYQGSSFKLTEDLVISLLKMH